MQSTPTCACWSAWLMQQDGEQLTALATLRRLSRELWFQQVWAPHTSTEAIPLAALSPEESMDVAGHFPHLGRRSLYHALLPPVRFGFSCSSQALPCTITRTLNTEEAIPSIKAAFQTAAQATKTLTPPCSHCWHCADDKGTHRNPVFLKSKSRGINSGIASLGATANSFSRYASAGRM